MSQITEYEVIHCQICLKPTRALSAFSYSARMYAGRSRCCVPTIRWMNWRCWHKLPGLKWSGGPFSTSKQIDPGTFIGSGKVEEVHQDIENLRADVLIFDDELSPRHQRELEKAMGENVKVIDRSTLILDIFAQHASTREGALQVELAQYEYRLPRLTRQWTHLARQAGVARRAAERAVSACAVPGETQLEIDRREISRKITQLKADLEDVRAQRSRHRDQRTKFGTPVVALVGYTNAGKSTLLNSLTGASVYAADKLFATLDPTTRRLELPGGKTVLVSDTVGFIQKLPTTVIAAFRATLEEVREADILIHVVDLSHPNAREQIEAVEDTLAEIEVPSIPRILVLNKADLWNGRQYPADYWSRGYNAVVPVSAREGTGLPQLLAEIEHILIEQMVEIQLHIPYKRGDLLSQIHALGVIDEETSTESGTRVRAHLPRAFAATLSGVRIHHPYEFIPKASGRVAEIIAKHSASFGWIITPTWTADPGRHWTHDPEPDCAYRAGFYPEQRDPLDFGVCAAACGDSGRLYRDCPSRTVRAGLMSEKAPSSHVGAEFDIKVRRSLALSTYLYRDRLR